MAGKLPLEPEISGKNPAEGQKRPPILLFVGNIQTQVSLCTLLSENNYSPLSVKDPEELLDLLKEKHFAIILIDCSAITLYGPRILFKIKVACQACRIIIFCDKAHLCEKPHRELIKDILKIGVYACILAPYKEWEVLSMLSFYPQK